MSSDPDRTRPFEERFLGEKPTRSLEDWHELFTEDRAFPIESTRPVVGPFLVWFRRLLRPIVRLPQNDLWERQRVFNLIALERLRVIDALDRQVQSLDQRLSALEASYKEGLDEVMRYNDALYSRVDAKLDGQSEALRETLAAVQAAANQAGTSAGAAPPPSSVTDALADAAYLAFEHRERGDSNLIRARVERYWPDLDGASRVLDLGCGRGEVLEFLSEKGVEALGVDGNGAMVRHCKDKGLTAVLGDLNAYLESLPAESFDAITSFHVIEHLAHDQLLRLLAGALSALKPGGILILETPNPESIVVGASNFWVDPTHRRPVHPTALKNSLDHAGFRSVEIRRTQRFDDERRLPEVDAGLLGKESEQLGQEINRLRDRIDQLLFGHQDYACIARK